MIDIRIRKEKNNAYNRQRSYKKTRSLRPQVAGHTDGGKSYEGFLLLDERSDVSYPDAVEGSDGYIYIIYDRERGALPQGEGLYEQCPRDPYGKGDGGGYPRRRGVERRRLS